MSKWGIHFLSATVMMSTIAGPALAATNVSLIGGILDSCILTLSTPGRLVADDSGMNMTSTAPLGAAAVLAVVATGGRPTVEFTAPTMSLSPGAYAGSPMVAVGYTSLGGANQTMTSGESSYRSNLLLDIVTIDGTITDANGFVAGDYAVSSVATCSQ
jgi:hypothetical protein|tara:strand:- start:66253 stop:66726 length:474 start_codon:yes stop_codon:yes gene_type:complete